MSVLLQEDFRSIIAEQLREQGLTQADLARRLGKTEQYVSQVLKGKPKSPGPTVMEEFLAALDLQPRLSVEPLSRPKPEKVA